MDFVEVQAYLNKRGQLTPTSFIWRKKNYLIDSIGRRWNDKDGQHMYVMIIGGRVFELLFKPATGGWYLGRIKTKYPRLA